MVLNRISKMVSYKERAYREIKEAILSQKLESGTPLNERTLAEELGISRTPIREALHLLESEGWVVTEPCRGTWVKEITIKDIVEVYQMRTALEGLAVELITDQLDQQKEAELKELLAQQKLLEDLMDTEEFTRIDMSFHLRLAEMVDNTRLLCTMNSFMDIMNMYLLRTVRRTQPISVPREEHIEIITKMLQRDSSSAREAMKQHMTRACLTAKKNLDRK